MPNTPRHRSKTPGLALLAGIRHRLANGESPTAIRNSMATSSPPRVIAPPEHNRDAGLLWNGKPWGELPYIERHELYNADPARYRAMRDANDAAPYVEGEQ